MHLLTGLLVINTYLLHRGAHVALTWTARDSVLFKLVMIQHNTRTDLFRACDTSLSPAILWIYKLKFKLREEYFLVSIRENLKNKLCFELLCRSQVGSIICIKPSSSNPLGFCKCLCKLATVYLSKTKDNKNKRIYIKLWFSSTFFHGYQCMYYIHWDPIKLYNCSNSTTHHVHVETCPHFGCVGFHRPRGDARDHGDLQFLRWFAEPQFSWVSRLRGCAFWLHRSLSHGRYPRDTWFV